MNRRRFKFQAKRLKFKAERLDVEYNGVKNQSFTLDDESKRLKLQAIRLIGEPKDSNYRLKGSSTRLKGSKTTLLPSMISLKG